MNPRLRNGLIAGAFVLLAVVAVLGWMRTTENGPAAVAAPTGYTDAAPATAQAPAVQPPPAGSQAAYDSYGQPAYNGSQPPGPPPVAASNAVYGDSYGGGYVSDRYVRSIHRPVVVRTQEYQARDYVEQQPAYSADRDARYGSPYEDRRGRSKEKSVAIVAGSAAGGAAIGAIAGGGKGAGIGAVAGGGAGFIYDRLTHNHR